MKNYLLIGLLAFCSIINAKEIDSSWLIKELSSYDIFQTINHNELILISDFIIERAEKNPELKNILEELYSESQTDFTDLNHITRIRNSKKIIRLLCIIKSELEGCCANLTAQNTNLINQIEIIISSLIFNVDLGPVFTTLTDIKSTITECCASLEEEIASLSNFRTFTAIISTNCDFTTVFTVLADIKLTITECCAVTQNNFNNTFTVLRDIKNTITECCAQTQINFNNTFTVLADLKSSITTLISVDFAGVFTTLNDIKNTLTICCATNQTNFSNTFTVLADIKNTLTICCATNQTNFNNTFTVLADIKDTITECCADLIFTITSLRPIAIVDFSTVFTALADIKLTLTQCCAQNQTNFNNTWTILADIKRTLTECCAANQTNFNSTFTAIADVKNTLTILITNGFNGTFTVLADIKNTLTTCCATTQANFAGTFTVLASIKSTSTISCTPTIIGANGQPVTISSPGSYCLANNITAAGTNAITINSNAVTLDLNGWTLQAPTSGDNAAIKINGAADNIVIKNGIITNSQISIWILSFPGAVDNVLIENLLISGGTLGPIIATALNSGTISNLTIKDCMIEFVNHPNSISFLSGVNASGIILFDNGTNSGLASISNVNIENCLISNCSASGIFFHNEAGATNDKNISVKDCIVGNNTSNGIDFASAIAVQLNTVDVIDCQSLNNTGTGITINAIRCTIQNTIANANTADGINLINSNFSVSNCVTNANTVVGLNLSSLNTSTGTVADCVSHQNGFVGINVNGNFTQVHNCNIVGTGSTAINRDGIRVNGTNNKIINSIVNNNRIGINADYSGADSQFLNIINCDVSRNTSHGITAFSSYGTIVNCICNSNSGDGIQVRGDSSIILSNMTQLNGNNGIFLTSTSPGTTNFEVRDNTTISNTVDGINDANASTNNRVYLNYATNNTIANFAGVDPVFTINPTPSIAFLSTNSVLDARNWVANVSN
ncbi:right-handed parallel beta-helix repeat-containing protein [Candidatus Dependentiae bacterium]|nr:right-handed parallel beta-helix repeat-containing protein [Candidatus Dependentiae bacterium]